MDWISALRVGDLQPIAELLDPDVVWHGVTGELVCGGRAGVVGAIGEQVPLCLDVEALELIAAPDRLVLGTRSPQLPDPPGAKLPGQVFNVFEHRDRRILTIRDFATREEALKAAGVAREAIWR